MHSRWVLLLCVLALIPLSGASAMAASGSWSAPLGIYNGMEVVFPSANAGATQIVFLNPNGTTPGYTDWYYDRQVFFMEDTGGAWSTPVVIGSNGMDRPTGWLPIVTHPVISGDGSTIAYLGCTGVCKPVTQGDRYDIYVSRRGASGWSSAAAVATVAETLSSQIGISADGKTLVCVTFIPFGDLRYRVYVVQRTGEPWGSPTAISSDTVNAFLPVLSRDGKQVIWRSNQTGGGSDVLNYASQLPGGGWSAPQALITNLILGLSVADYSSFSSDGNSIFYWNVDTVGSDLTHVYLYVLRRVGSAWGFPQQVTPGVLPYTNEGFTAAVNSDGTRVVYPDPLLHADVFDDVSLQMVENKSETWGAPAAVSAHKEGAMYRFPMMSDDGKRLLALGPSPEYDGPGLALFTYSVKYFTYLPFMKK